MTKNTRQVIQELQRFYWKTGQPPQHENLAFPVFFASRRKRGAGKRAKISLCIFK